MKREDLRIVYLGTPDFAVESLRRLVEGGYNVVGVVTMPDKPFGRHQNHLRPSPVKEYALQAGLPLLQPVSLKDPGFLAALREWHADLQIVVAFRMLPEAVWAMPRLGTFNLHASLLPQYRGAAPINWAIINGDRETGITTFFLKHEIDVGDVIDQVRTPIAADDDFGTIHDRLMLMGGDLVVKTVDRLLDGDLSARLQSEMAVGEELRPAPKIFRETCQINWRQPATKVLNLIRGLSPVPAAWSAMSTPQGDTTIKVYKARLSDNTSVAWPGTIEVDGRGRLSVACGDGWLDLTEVQLAGKKRMATADLLRGYRMGEGHVMVVE